MIAKVEILSDVQKIGAEIIKREKKASETALTQAAFHLRNRMTKEIKDSIKAPTPRTEKAQIFKVYKDKQYVLFFLNPAGGKGGVSPAKYLSPLIFGGPRGQKAMDKYFGARYLVPSPKTKLDAHGNIPGKQVMRMLSDLKALREVGAKQNATGKRRAKKKDGYFFVESQRTPGVGVVLYRQGNTVTPFAAAIPRAPKYETGTLDWFYTVEKFWPEYITEELSKELKKQFGG